MIIWKENFLQNLPRVCKLSENHAFYAPLILSINEMLYFLIFVLLCVCVCVILFVSLCFDTIFYFTFHLYECKYFLP